MRAILEERDFPVGELRLLASARSAGRKLPFNGAEVEVQELGPGSFDGVDLVFFAAGGSVSKEFAPQAVARRRDRHRQVERVPPGSRRAAGRPRGERRPPGVAHRHHRDAQLLDHPDGRRAQAHLRRRRHRARRRQHLPGRLRQRPGRHRRACRAGRASGPAGEPVEQQFYPHQIAFNVLPHIDSFLPTGSTKEEQKMVDETTKIFADPDLKVTATCVRVPVFGAHSEAVNVQTKRKLSAAEARELSRRRRASRSSTTRQSCSTPCRCRPRARTPSTSAASARTRPSPTASTSGSSRDNLRKGAALNAVQIAEELVGARAAVARPAPTALRRVYSRIIRAPTKHRDEEPSLCLTL